MNLVRATVLAGLLCALLLPSHAGAGIVSAHVHAVTPLNDCSVDNAEHSGGRTILRTSAAAENGGPIQPGPIPLNTGNAAFGPGGGGGHAEPRCP
jgi:hypothetical protein